MANNYQNQDYTDDFPFQMNNLGEIQFFTLPKWPLRMAYLAMVGTSIGFQEYYLGGSGYSVLHNIFRHFLDLLYLESDFADHE